MPGVEVHHVTKRFGTATALDGVSLIVAFAAGRRKPIT